MASVKPIYVSSQDLLTYTNPAAVSASVGPGGAPTVLGRGPTHFVAPALPDSAFNARGRGRFGLIETVPPGDVRFTRGPRIAGPQGTIDLWVDMGAAGTARDILVLADSNDPASFTGSIEVSISATTNRPFITIVDAVGTTVGQTTPSAGAYADGERVHLRLTWDSAAPVVGGTGGRHATFAINGEQVPASDWSTDPTSAWDAFVPVDLWLGIPSGNSEFNGTVLAVQASNITTP